MLKNQEIPGEKSPDCMRLTGQNLHIILQLYKCVYVCMYKNHQQQQGTSSILNEDKEKTLVEKRPGDIS